MTEAASRLVYSTESDRLAGADEFEQALPEQDEAHDATPGKRALSESALTARARTGDVDAFATLVRAHEAELMRLAYRTLSDRDAAEAVVLETLRGAWRRRSGETESASFRITLSRIVMRRCLALAARTAKSSAGAGPQPTDDSTGLGRTPEGEVDGDDLETALASLSPEDRACWVLKELHSLSDNDIAFAVSVSSGTVSGSVSRARRQLIARVGSA